MACMFLGHWNTKNTEVEGLLSVSPACTLKRCMCQELLGLLLCSGLKAPMCLIFASCKYSACRSLGNMANIGGYAGVLELSRVSAIEGSNCLWASMYLLKALVLPRKLCVSSHEQAMSALCKHRVQNSCACTNSLTAEGQGPRPFVSGGLPFVAHLEIGIPDALGLA